MKNFYDPNSILKIDSNEIDEDYIPQDLFIDTKKDGLFHIGQSYEENVCETAFCKHCGGNKFNVGIGDYFTAVKCVVCGWELSIHKG